MYFKFAGSAIPSRVERKPPTSLGEEELSRCAELASSMQEQLNDTSAWDHLSMIESLSAAFLPSVSSFPSL